MYGAKENKKDARNERPRERERETERKERESNVNQPAREIFEDLHMHFRILTSQSHFIMEVLHNLCVCVRERERERERERQSS
jgi:hypothetical protein